MIENREAIDEALFALTDQITMPEQVAYVVAKLGRVLYLDSDGALGTHIALTGALHLGVTEFLNSTRGIGDVFAD